MNHLDWIMGTNVYTTKQINIKKIDNMSIGYSVTRLEEKLGIKEGFSIYLVNEPPNYFNLFTNLPKVNIMLHPRSKVDFIHAFFTSREELKLTSNFLKQFLKENGMLWVSWPRGSSIRSTGLNSESIRDHHLKIGFVDVQVCDIDQDWRGIKFLIPKNDRMKE